MSLKAHKTPWKMRPIVCCVSTFMNDLSCWLNYWLQKLKPFVASYIRNSNDFLKKTKQLGRLPPNAKLFTANGVLMYTNIDTDHAIDVISSGRLPDGFPLDAINKVITLVMPKISSNGEIDTSSSSSGLPWACMWATIYFAIWEARKLLPTYGRHLIPAQDRGPLVPYSQQLLVYVGFIGNIFSAWLGFGSSHSWDQFKHDTSLFGILQWEFDESSSSTTFLDLTILIKNDKIITKTY
ncbi:hypothetical protein ACHAWF_008382 [Thalassiosira exigua]